MTFGAGAASAQGVNVRIGVGEPGYHHRMIRDHRRPVVERRVVERRVMRPMRARTLCRTVVRECVRANGVVVRRPTEICRRSY